MAAGSTQAATDWSSQGLLKALAIVGGFALLALGGLFLQRREVKLLRASKERFRALIDHSFDVTVVLNPDGSAKYISPSGIRWFGGGQLGGPVLLNRFSGVIHPDECPEPRPPGRGITDYVIRTRRPLLANLQKNAELKQAGEYIQTGAPADIWLGVPLTLPDQTAGVMAVQDYRNEHAFGEEEKQILTFVAGQTAVAIARKRAEAELLASAARLRQSEERFARAFWSSPAMLSIARLDTGRYVDANDAFLRVAGYERAEVIGRTWVELGFFGDSPARDAFFKTLRDKGSIRNVEATFSVRSGAKRILLLSADLIEIDQVPCLLSASVDITERKQAEEELLKALARERELSQLKSNFVSMVSHEFRTPLGVILSSAEILDRYFHKIDEAARVEYLQAIQQSTRRMARMMETVLLFGRMEAGKLQFDPADLDLPMLCQRVTDEMLSATDDRCPIRLRSELPEARACGDEGLLRHILSNLLSNAVKYSAAGSPVEFDLSRAGSDAVSEIRDRGLGIPASDLERVFSAFNRGRNVGHLPGTGLGLVVVKRCVELHGGQIELQSAEGSGTAVIIRLPLFASANQAGS